jgi:hypothetical protein
LRTGIGSPGEYIVGVEFTRQRMGQFHESYGPLKLYVDDSLVAEAKLRTMTGHFPRAARVCASAPSTSQEFTSGRSSRSSLTSPMTPYVDVGRHLAAQSHD